jgi:hypothetical protein
MITFENLKPTSQGTLGVGIAIGYFSSQGYIVSVPLSDNQKYDLLVDSGDGIKKVQVKTSSFKQNGNYSVFLQTVCPKKTSKNVITRFDNTCVDYLFVVTEDGMFYNIPASEIKAKASMRLNKNCDKYKVIIGK